MYALCAMRFAQQSGYRLQIIPSFIRPASLTMF
jgi:hypothetical protein